MFIACTFGAILISLCPRMVVIYKRKSMEGLGLSAHQRLRGNKEHFPLILMGFV